MHPDWILLEEMFAKHRQEAFVCCDEKCFCWDVEKWLFDVEEIRPTRREPDWLPLTPEQVDEDLDALQEAMSGE